MQLRPKGFPKWRPSATAALAILSQRQQQIVAAQPGSLSTVNEPPPVGLLKVAREVWFSKAGVDDNDPLRGAYDRPYRTFTALARSIRPPTSKTDFDGEILIRCRGPGNFSDEFNGPPVTLPTRRMRILGDGVVLPPIRWFCKESLRFSSSNAASLWIGSGGEGMPLFSSDAPPIHIIQDDPAGGDSLRGTTETGDEIVQAVIELAGVSTEGSINFPVDFPLSVLAQSCRLSSAQPSVLGESLSLELYDTFCFSIIDVDFLVRASRSFFLGSIEVNHGALDPSQEGMDGCYFFGAGTYTGPIGDDLVMDIATNDRFKRAGWTVVDATKLILDDTVA